MAQKLSAKVMYNAADQIEQGTFGEEPVTKVVNPQQQVREDSSSEEKKVYAAGP